MMQMPTIFVIKQIITLDAEALCNRIVFRQQIEHWEMINGSNRRECCLEWD